MEMESPEKSQASSHHIERNKSRVRQDRDSQQLWLTRNQSILAGGFLGVFVLFFLTTEN